MGRDVVCAAVSSAVQLTINGITEIVRCGADVSVKEKGAQVSLILCEGYDSGAQDFIRALKLHLTDLQERYVEFIEISDTEV